MVALQHMAIIPLFFFFFLIIILHKCLSHKNAPPSPRKLQIIGNLHQLGPSPHRSLRALSNLHGPNLMLLRLGRVPVLVASSAEAAREIMKNQDVIFSNRPKLSIPDRLIYGSRDVAFAPYGEYWRQVRTISVVNLLSNTRVNSYGRVFEEETSAMVERIGRREGFVTNLSDELVSLTNDVVCRVALGRKYEKFYEFLGEFVELLGVTAVGDYVPWFGWIIDRVNGLDARVESVAEWFDEFLENVIREHKRVVVDEDKDEFDFVDILLEYQRENASVSPVEDETIKALVLEMFVAGTDTTASALEWAMAELIKNPRTMRVLQNEVRRVAGTKEELDKGDMEKMFYLKAVIKETLRLHSPVPLLIPRESTRDTKVLGYNISAGTRVLINAWAIGRDPSSWDRPEEFRPGRFMDSSVDFKGQHFELIPFGAGRRGCPGIALATAVVELALAKLVHKFDFALPNGEREEDMDMSETRGVTLHKKLPLLVVATPYTSST